jgi:hypothetical protein
MRSRDETIGREQGEHERASVNRIHIRAVVCCWSMRGVMVQLIARQKWTGKRECGQSGAKTSGAAELPPTANIEQDRSRIEQWEGGRQNKHCKFHSGSRTQCTHKETSTPRRSMFGGKELEVCINRKRLRICQEVIGRWKTATDTSRA